MDGEEHAKPSGINRSTQQYCIPARECGGWRAWAAGRRTAKPAGQAEAGEKAWSRGAAHGTTATTRATETSEGSRERRRRAAVRVVGFALFFFLFSYWIVCGSI